MLNSTKRKQSNADISDDGSATKRTSNVLGYNAHSPWLQDSRSLASRRSLGNRAHAPSLALHNMVSTVQDLIDPDFDPLIALLDDEPRFLKPLPSRVAPEDLEFLRFRGALAIPENELRTELLRCYIKWVHSFMPVLNLQDFLRCISENDPEGNISLLLFQAVMFVATAFVDLKHLQAAGYTTRKSARSAFYTRLRLLYSLDCEDDRIVILQTLLLMTYWSDHMNHPQRDIWDWIGVCNTQAHSIGLNRDPSGSNLDEKTRRLRTRLWWSLYSRDRLIAMGLRRPTQVNEGTSNLPMLRLEDFDFEPFHPAVIEQFHCRQLEDLSHQKRLATMFIEKAKLCQCIGRVLFAQYTPSQYQFGVTNRTTINLVPRQASESELARCSQRLESWLGTLPKDAQFIPASRTNFSDGEDVLLLHGAMVRMLYHATISALHRPWAFGSTKDQTKARQELANIARTKMQDAALGITHIIQGLNQLNLTRYLPQSGVTVILPAAVAHLANSMSDNPALRETSIHNFQRCIQVLQGLKDIYPAADMEVANIEAAVKAHPNSTNTLLRIMQLNSSNQTKSEDQSPREMNSTSYPSPHTIPSSSKVNPIPSHWTPPHDEQDVTGPQKPPKQGQNAKAATSPRTDNIPPATREPSTQFQPTKKEHPTPPSDFITPFSSTTNSNLIDPVSSLLATDLFNFDFYSNNFGPADVEPSAPVALDMDWTNELLRWAEPNPEYYSSAMTDDPRDSFPFPAQDQSPPASRHKNPTNTFITGDLDQDLGMGDEIF